MAACFSTPMFAQDPSKKATEDLVKAAQDSKSKRKKSSTKVITNKDVRQAEGQADRPGHARREKDGEDRNDQLVAETGRHSA